MNIPIPARQEYNRRDGEGWIRPVMEIRVQAGRQSREETTDSMLRGDGPLSGGTDQGQAPKKSVGCFASRPVPETDTGGQGEYPKALERTRAKELGIIVP